MRNRPHSPLKKYQSYRRFVKATMIAVLAIAAGALYSETFGQANNNPQTAQSELTFAFIGDMPYGPANEPRFQRLVDDINSDPSVQFVIHAGDIKSGSELCSDALIEHRFSLYQNFNIPFIYTPGDNEWTDCHRQNNGPYYPLDRLAFVRQTFFPDPDFSTGSKKIRVVSQTHVPGYEDFVENVWFRRNDVIFATLHVVGSDNDLRPWTGSTVNYGDAGTTLGQAHLNEISTRTAADNEWLDEVFAAGVDAKGIFIAIQANPNVDDFDPGLNNDLPTGFHDFLARLLTKAKAYGKPVVLGHGDNHTLLIDKPFDEESPVKYNPPVMNLTRLQTFGQSNVHWTKVYVDSKSADVFKFEPHVISLNVP